MSQPIQRIIISGRFVPCRLAGGLEQRAILITETPEAEGTGVGAERVERCYLECSNSKPQGESGLLGPQVTVRGSRVRTCGKTER